jgi:hypothetical protein
MLACGSFSDQNLDTRGWFEAFRRAGSKHKWLDAPREGKSACFNGDEARPDAPRKTCSRRGARFVVDNELLNVL